MLLSRQESDIDLFFTRRRNKIIDFYYISQSCFHLPKNNIRKIILFEQTLRDIIILLHDIAGLDMNSENWKQLCRKAWENEYVYLQLERFAEIGEVGYTIRICNKATCTVCTPETKSFRFS